MINIHCYIMDKIIQAPLGPDLIFGTADDISMNFGTDRYGTQDLEDFKGIDDTLNTVAFGLSTGKGAPAASATFSSTRVTLSRTGGLTPSLFDSLQDEEKEVAVI